LAPFGGAGWCRAGLICLGWIEPVAPALPISSCPPAYPFTFHCSRGWRPAPGAYRFFFFFKCRLCSPNLCSLNLCLCAMESASVYARPHSTLCALLTLHYFPRLYFLSGFFLHMHVFAHANQPPIYCSSCCHFGLTRYPVYRSP
jgi:hypothetical protein